MTFMFLFQGEEESQVSKTTQIEQDQYEMQVRGANIVRFYLHQLKSTYKGKIYLDSL